MLGIQLKYNDLQRIAPLSHIGRGAGGEGKATYDLYLPNRRPPIRRTVPSPCRNSVRATCLALKI